MKKNKKLSDALGVICVALIFAGCVEGINGELTWWTPTALVIAGLFGWLSYLTTPEQTPKTNSNEREHQ